MGVSKDRGGLG